MNKKRYKFLPTVAKRFFKIKTYTASFIFCGLTKCELEISGEQRSICHRNKLLVWMEWDTPSK